MNLAFTGTRKGMSALQYKTVLSLVKELEPDWAGHGDCIGADNDFHKICIIVRGSITSPDPPKIHIFPSNAGTRAHNEDYDIIEPERDSLVRNRHMAKWCQKLIATPKEENEIIRSGTWATVRYGRRERRVIYLVLPNGKIR